jgi:ABC-2 type transport system permease protein
MVGVGVAPSTRAQLSLFATLRWQIFRNSLRTWQGRLQVAAFAFTSVLFGAAVLGSGAGLGAVAYIAVKHGEFQFLSAALWAVFVAWQLLPLYISAVAAQFDFSNLLRFPLRYSSFWVLSLAYGLLDPAAVGAILWLVCIVIGVTVARSDLLPWTLLTLAAFAAVNLLLSRTVFAWLERWLARRRSRELLGLVFLVALLSSQLARPLAERWGQRAVPLARRLQPVFNALPPGLGRQALASAAHDRPLAALGTNFFLALYGLVFAGALELRLRAQYRGDDLGEGQAPARLGGVPTVRAARPGWNLPSLSGPVGALVEKELRYLLRNGPLLFSLVMPVLLLLVLDLTGNRPARGRNPFATMPELMFSVGVGFAMLGLTNLSYDSLGFDGRGVQLLFIAPVRFRDVLLSKNLAQCIAFVVQLLVIWIAVSLRYRPPGEMVLLATLSALPLALAVNLGAGNLLSLYFPRQKEFGAFRRQGVSPVALLTSLLMQIVVVGFGAITLLWARSLHRLWMAAVIFLAAGVLAAWGYTLVLDRCGLIALQRRETLTAELCR